MPISKDLFLAILAMDSYNQGYGRGIDHGKTQIGAATIKVDDTSAEAQSAGFYAIAYDVGGSGPSGLAGKTLAPNQTP